MFYDSTGDKDYTIILYLRIYLIIGDYHFVTISDCFFE